MFRASEMIRALTGKEIQSADFEFSEAIVDSRKTTGKSLFVAIPGENSDGHEFVPAAFSAGAKGALIQEDLLSLIHI